MTIAIVVSRADSASEHIGDQLLDRRDWTEQVDESRPDTEGGGTYYRSAPFELRTFDELHIDLSDPATAFGDEEADVPDLLVFVSRHSGETGPLLTGHFTGNFGAAEFGGDDRELSSAAPSALSVLVSAMAAHAPEGYDVGIEGTHHGPTDVSCPSLFAEVGSDEPQWADPDAARAVAQAVLSLRGVDPHREKQLVGFGGGHYAPRFGRVVRETPWAVGHVASDWQLDALGDPDTGPGRAVIRQAFEKSGAHLALFDGDYPGVEAVVEDLGYRVVGETWVREVGDRPLGLVETLEDRLATVEEGLRFGGVDPVAVGDAKAAATGDAEPTATGDAEPAATGDAKPAATGDAEPTATGDAEPTATDESDWDAHLVVVDLPDDLLTEAQGIDAGATREAVAATTVAFETVESGTRARGRAAVADEADRESLVEALAAILRESYDEVEVTDDAVVAREEAFDPQAAADLGVPEGPAFGRLAAGESVVVDGEEVRPEDVRRERRSEFPV